jgi:hypothetical protein
VKKPIHILLFLTVIFLAGISGAEASNSHHHHEGVSNSPFQGKLKSHSLHCELNKHFGQTCPHTRTLGDTKEVRLAVDCGGNPNGTAPTVPGSSNHQLLFSADFPSPVVKNAENIFISSYFFQSFFSDPIEHHPRVS